MLWAIAAVREAGSGVVDFTAGTSTCWTPLRACNWAFILAAAAARSKSVSNQVSKGVCETELTSCSSGVNGGLRIRGRTLASLGRRDGATVTARVVLFSGRRARSSVEPRCSLRLRFRLVEARTLSSVRVFHRRDLVRVLPDLRTASKFESCCRCMRQTRPMT